jgi:hypothetical protein
MVKDVVTASGRSQPIHVVLNWAQELQATVK